MDARSIENLRKEIDKTVDDWLAGVVKDRFTQKPVGHKPRSLWDRLKQGVTNWWWGPKGDKYNPYAWRNRFGDDLGAEGEVAGDPRTEKSEGFDPSIFTLQEYMEIRGLVDSLEMRLDESGDFENLRLMSMLRSVAVDLKNSLHSVVSRHLSNLSQRSKRPGGEGKPATGGEGKPAPGGEGKPAPGGEGKPAPGGEGKARQGTSVVKSKKYIEKKQKLEGFFKDFVDEEGDSIHFARTFYGFLEFYIDEHKDKSSELKAWFGQEVNKLKVLEVGRDEESWREKIVKTDEFIEAISDIVNRSPERVLDDMVGYLEAVS